MKRKTFAPEALTSRPRGAGQGRRRFRALALGALCLGLVVTLAACGGSGSGASGKSITLAVQYEPRTLASWDGYSSDGYTVIRNVEEALINRDPKSNDLVPELATSWKQVDPKTWDFSLRKGVKFTDGSAFDADAAAYSLNYTLDPKNAFAIRSFLGPDVTFTAKDQYTVEAKTAEADPILPTRLYFVPIVSAKLLKDSPDKYATTPVGTGPYKFVAWNRGQNIKLTANTNWWGRKDASAARGSNTAIKDVTFRFPSEASVRAAQVKTGEAQEASWLTRDQCKQAPKCLQTPGVETFILRLDTPNPALKDLRVRKAIAMAFSKQQIMSDLLGGGRPSGSIDGPSAFGVDTSLKPYPQDVAAAKKLISEARADGVPVDDAFDVQAEIGVNSHANEMVQYIAQSLRNIGLKNVKSQMRDKASMEKDWTAGYKAITPARGMLGLQSHGQELMDFSGSVQSYYTCGGPTSAYCDPKLDQMFNAATPLTGDARKTALEKIDNYMYQQVPVVPVGQPNFFYGIAKNLDWTPRLDGFLLVKEMKFS
jgi:peptide/nickel transport system substrate-binding protein